MAVHGYLKIAVIASVGFGLAGCEDGKGVDLFKKKPSETGSTASAATAKTIERDVESPDVFSANEAGLWDGRPSLGGVWVAHPGAKDPERVIIRNETNGNFVIGALFRKERETPGPKLQVSSDAAEALGLLAGQPIKLSVVALRREEVVIEPAEPAKTADEDIQMAEASPAEDAVEETTLDPIQSAAAALDAVDGGGNAASATKPAAAQAEKPAKPAAQPAAKPTPKPVAAAPKKPTGITKPFLQIGIFSVEDNANRTAETMRKAGVVPTVKKQSSRGKTFWRVIVGPVSSNGEKSDLLATVKKLGYGDAYYVTN